MKKHTVLICVAIATLIQIVLINLLGSSQLAQTFGTGLSGIILSGLPIILVSVLIGYLISRYKNLTGWAKKQRNLVMFLVSLVVIILSLLFYANALFILR